MSDTPASGPGAEGGTPPPGAGGAPDEAAEHPAAEHPAVEHPAAEQPGAEQPDTAGDTGPDGEVLEVLDIDDELAAMMGEAADGAPQADAALVETARQRDEYLDALRRMQADFENFKKRTAKQLADATARAAEGLVDKLLPALDTVDLAVTHGGGDEIRQVWTVLIDTLGKEGLERIAPTGEAFDPTRHDAVMHEPAEGESDAQEVAEVLRAGYAWKGRVLRPAMVKVRG